MYKEDILDKELYNIFSKSTLKGLIESKLTELAKDNKISVRKMYERFLWLKKMGIDPNEIHLKENHELIYHIFDEYNKMLNDNHIEYYYTSGILSYLLVDKELVRYHHDLDIFVNMKDLELLENISSKYGFTFERKLGDREDGTKRIMIKMYYKDHKEIPITVFMYVRELDGSITQYDYYLDNLETPLVEEMYNSKDIVRLSFDDKEYYHNGIKYYAITKEALYLSKKGNRPKDIYDCEVFKDSVNILKLDELLEAFKHNKKNEVKKGIDNPYYDLIFTRFLGEKNILKYD